MALKTFNIDSEIYKEFSNHCKKQGISMSRKVENYIRAELSRIKCDVNQAVKEVEAVKIPKNSSEFMKSKKLLDINDTKEHPLMKYC